MDGSAEHVGSGIEQRVLGPFRPHEGAPADEVSSVDVETVAATINRLFEITFDVPRMPLAGDHGSYGSRPRGGQKAFQQGRSEGRGESYCEMYVEPLDGNTLLANLFNTPLDDMQEHIECPLRVRPIP